MGSACRGGSDDSGGSRATPSDAGAAAAQGRLAGRRGAAIAMAGRRQSVELLLRRQMIGTQLENATECARGRLDLPAVGGRDSLVEGLLDLAVLLLAQVARELDAARRLVVVDLDQEDARPAVDRVLVALGVEGALTLGQQLRDPVAAAAARPAPRLIASSSPRISISSGECGSSEPAISIRRRAASS